MITLSVKKIAGKIYQYATDTLYINKGVHIIKNKSLGRAESITDTPKKLSEFKKEIEDLEIQERSRYWEPKTVHHKIFEYQPIKKLEMLRTSLYRGKQNLGYVGNRAMDTAFIIDFIYNSNKIEGSRLPHKQVQAIVNTGLKGKNDEVTNTIRAIEFFNSEGFPLSLTKLKKGQRILLAHEKSKHGFRKEPFIVGNSPVLDHEDIDGNLEELFNWYKKNEFKVYPLELAFIFHYRFERIHPFPDGNGRTGRIIMNNILKKHKFHPIIVWNSRREAYFSSFEKAMEGNQNAYMKLMIDQYVRTYEIYLKRLEPAISFDTQLQQFLVPSE